MKVMINAPLTFICAYALLLSLIPLVWTTLSVFSSCKHTFLLLTVVAIDFSMENYSFSFP